MTKSLFLSAIGKFALGVVLIGALLAIFAQAKVSSAYSKWSGVNSRGGMTGAEMARVILDGNGCRDVRIEQVAGKLTDHFDPQDGVLRLSREVYHSSSIAAIGVAAHEAGHAIQDAQGYVPMNIRANLVPLANIGSQAAMPIFLLGLLMSWEPVLKIGIACFLFAVLFYLVTLPVELNASSRAVAVLSDGYMAEDELKGVKAVLSAAALTYVASAVQAVLQLLRLLLIANSRRRRD